MSTAWGADWEDKVSGRSCAMCRDLGLEVKPGGARFLAGRWGDAYLSRCPVRPGYAYVVWNGRHVVEPTELTPEEATGFWLEVLTAARAVETRYRPLKLNYLVLGNGVPHLHVHLVPRYAVDEDAGRPLPADAWERARSHPFTDDDLREQTRKLRSLVGDEPPAWP